MQIPFLISKIHRATVTATDIDYEGSIAIDEAIIEKAGIRPFQKVEIYNIANGRDSRAFIVNGAAAHLVTPGDIIIIAAYALIDEKELGSLNATVLHLNKSNEIERVTNAKL